MLKKFPTIPIEPAKLKPIRCKNSICPTAILGFASEQIFFIASGGEISVSGETNLAKGTRRSHAAAIRVRRNIKQNTGVTGLEIDSNLLAYAQRLKLPHTIPDPGQSGKGYIFATCLPVNGRKIVQTCSCGRRRKIVGMKFLIESGLADLLILIDRIDSKS